MDQSANRDKHFLALDGLRGIAIICVVVFHYGYDAQLADPLHGPASLVFTLFDFGWLGVDLFFVLSGFLITGILLKSKGRRRGLTSFYARRALRIFPAYYALLTAFLVVAPLAGHPLIAESPTKHQVWLWLYGTNLIPNVNFADLGPLWTLAVEEHFYLLWPILVFSLSTQSLRRACLLSIPIAVGARFCGLHSSFEDYTFKLVRFDSLAIGALLATYSLDSTVVRRRSLLVGAASATASAIALILSRLAPETRPSVLCFGYPIFAATFAAIIFLAAARTMNETALNVLDWAPLRSVGKYSYGIYLLHLPILRTSAWVSRALHIYTDTLRGKLGWISVFCVLSYLLAYASWNLYERQFLRLKKYFPS